MPLAKLTPTHKDKLVALLLACPCTQHASDRQLLTTRLPDKVRYSIPLGATYNTRIEIGAILTAYLHFYDPDLDILLAAVRFFDDGKQSFIALEKYVQELKGISSTQVRQQLQPPPPPEKFGGRSAELADLKNRLQQDAATLALTAIVGQGGIGKTTLARQAAHELFHLDKQFRAVLWVEIKPNPSPDQLLLNWAKLGNPNFTTDGQSIKDFIPIIKASMETLIADEGIECGSERILIVFDDVWEDGIPAVKLLKEAMPDHACVLITTRHEQVRIGLGAARGKLDRLETPQAVELLQQYLTDVPELPQGNLAELAEVLGGHSRALTLAAKRLLEDPHPIAGLTRHIKQYQKGLTEGTSFTHVALDPDDKDENLERSLSYSYETLLDRGQTRFRALGALIYDQPVDLKLLAALWGNRFIKRRGNSGAGTRVG